MPQSKKNPVKHGISVAACCAACCSNMPQFPVNMPQDRSGDFLTASSAPTGTFLIPCWDRCAPFDANGWVAKLHGLLSKKLTEVWPWPVDDRTLPGLDR